MQKDKVLDDKPWWQFGHLWLVISGPAIVIVASFITLYLVLTSPNEVISGQDMEVGTTNGAKMIKGGEASAMQARNHAQTGEVPVANQSTAKP